MATNTHHPIIMFNLHINFSTC